MKRRVKIVLSDLHLGAGRVEDGNVLEDFTVDEAFRDFLRKLRDESEAHGLEIELILAGDTFEFLQVPHVDEYDPTLEYQARAYRSSSATDSVQKARHIVAGHPVAFRALRDWLQPDGPRRKVTIVKGNHDVNLHWRSVRQVLREEVDAVGPRNHCLAFEERRVRRDDIWVEHGNQYTGRLNRFDDFEEPHDPDDSGQLSMPLGSRFVLGFFNGIERERYWIDGLKPVTSLIWYLLTLDLPFALRALVALLREVPSLVWPHPPWGGADLDAEHALGEVTDDPSRVRAIALQYDQNPAFRQRLMEWAQDSLDRLGLTREGTPEEGLDERVDPNSAVAALRRGAYAQVADRTTLEKVAAAREVEDGARVVVFGHTHSPTILALPRGGVYVNTGTWTWHRDFTREGVEAWRDFFENPGRHTTARDLTYARIDYDTEEPVARLLRHVYEAPPMSILDRIRSWWRRFVRRLRPRRENGR